MKAENLSIRYVPLNTLKENPENARLHGSEIEFIVNSIEKFGFASPILVDKKNVIIAGHGRLQAARKVGLEKVPVIRLPFDSEESKAYGLIDNALTDLSTWDMDKYDAQLAELGDLGWEMDEFGFMLPDFNDEPEDGIQLDPVEEAPVTPPAAKESFNVMVFCKNKEEQDKVLAFILKNNIAGQMM